jgi:hypothetical protein
MRGTPMSMDSKVGSVDRAALLVETRQITQPRLDVPPLTETLERTEHLTVALKALTDELAGTEREAVRVMWRLAVRVLAEPPGETASPFPAWQYLLNLARTGQALLDVVGRTR